MLQTEDAIAEGCSSYQDVVHLHYLKTPNLIFISLAEEVHRKN